MQVNVHEAKTQLSKLIEAALSGEEVIIARGPRPAVRLVPFPQGSLRLGLLAADLGAAADIPDASGALSDWEGG